MRRLWLAILAVVLLLAGAAVWLRPVERAEPQPAAAAARESASEYPVLVKEAGVVLPSQLTVKPGSAVMVEISIQGDGTVRAARVLKTDVPEANDAVLAAVKQYRFDMPPSLRDKGKLLRLGVQLAPSAPEPRKNP